jgi:gentisate 1,2-dioxygenase
MTTSEQAANVPADYASALQRLSLGAAWTQIRNLTPRGRPIRGAGAMSWRYADVRPRLIEAGQIVSAAREAQRRGHTTDPSPENQKGNLTFGHHDLALTTAPRSSVYVRQLSVNLHHSPPIDSP